MSIWYFFAVVFAALQTLLIGTMRRTGAFRQHPLIFLYAIALLLSNVVEWASVLGFGLTNNRAYALYWWTNEIILQLLLFSIMIALIHRAARETPARWILTAGSIVAVVLVCALIVLLRAQGAPDTLSKWITVVSRNLSFCSALLNLALWSVILRRKSRHFQLLLLSLGLGLQTTGKAIGHSLRGMSPAVEDAGNWVITLSMICCLLIWWYAFKANPILRDGSGLGTPRQEFA